MYKYKLYTHTHIYIYIHNLYLYMYMCVFQYVSLTLDETIAAELGPGAAVDPHHLPPSQPSGLIELRIEVQGMIVSGFWVGLRSMSRVSGFRSGLGCSRLIGGECWNPN